MLDTTKTLCLLSGVSGFEDEVRDYILERVLPYADELETDSLGNLIVHKKGKVPGDKRVAFFAHMDEVGVIITGADDDGFLRFDFIGGVDRRVAIGKRVCLGFARVPGVIGIKAHHLVSREEEKKIPSLSAMYIDVGAPDRKSALELVCLGDVGVFSDQVTEFGEGFLAAKALDDRIGCAALIKLIESELPLDCDFVFTAQEEVGARGAKVASARLNPDVAIIIESTTAADLPEVPEGKTVCRLGEGLVLPYMDKGAMYSRELYSALTALCDANNIKWQTKGLIAGGTDAQVIQRSGAGVATAAISAPVRSLHAPISVAKIEDFETIPRLAMLFLESLVNETPPSFHATPPSFRA
ncbi:MAG: M42 family peptidase [Oscillospiraceae bacterium]|jgi:endoglucanase|nr:M42 family peptidase [Oscillospiraceae bacterium]